MATGLREKRATPATRAFIAQTVRDVLEDQDFGLGLTAGAKKRLKEARKDTKKRTPLSKIK
ncbi:MAG: hypothetical protein Q8R12_04965 [bacterium]|nr:hypothetical protein [bacterium]